LSFSRCEQLARGFVKFHAGEFLEDGFVGNFQGDNLLRLDFQISQQLDLLEVEGAAVKDPSVQATVRLA